MMRRAIFCIENDEICINNDIFCMKNDEICIEKYWPRAQVKMRPSSSHMRHVVGAIKTSLRQVRDSAF